MIEAITVIYERMVLNVAGKNILPEHEGADADFLSSL